jgi:predicted RNase H-like HicB family nuclease
MARDPEAGRVATVEAAEPTGTAPVYLVVIEAGPPNFSAYVPDLPGCIATGETREEVIELMREGIPFHLEGMRLNGDPIPPPTSTAVKIPVPAEIGK